MIKCILGLAPNHWCHDVIMHVDSHGCEARNGENIDLYVPCVIEENYERSFNNVANIVWNKLLMWQNLRFFDHLIFFNVLMVEYSNMTGPASINHIDMLYAHKFGSSCFSCNVVYTICVYFSIYRYKRIDNFFYFKNQGLCCFIMELVLLYLP